MRNKTINCSTAFRLVALPVAFCAVAPGWAQQPPVHVQATAVDSRAGQVANQSSMLLQGRVTGLDKERRTVDIRGGSGADYHLIVNPGAAGFDEIHLGDLVTVTFQQSLTLGLTRDAAGIRERVESENIIHSPPDQKPGVVFGKDVRIIAEVLAVDVPGQTVTVRGPSRTAQLHLASRDILDRLRVGDGVELFYAEATAMFFSRDK